MLYLTKLERLNNGKVIYNLFETHTDSVIKCSEQLVIALVTTSKMEAKNIYIDRGQVKLKKWPITIKSTWEDTPGIQSDYILLGKYDSKHFAVTNQFSRRIYFEEAELKSNIRLGRVANCTYSGTTNKEYKSIDTYNMQRNPEFERCIAQRYAEFVAKSTLIGLRTSFEYIIECEDVKLVKYTGNSKKVILPSFITSICDDAFYHNRINSITLNSGLKYIGSNAFMGCSLLHIAIPDSVEFIGKAAFGTLKLTDIQLARTSAVIIN